MAAPIYEAETPRLYLERLSEDKHLEDFHEQWNTDEGVIWSRMPKSTSIEETRKFMVKSVLPTPETADTDKFAIILKDVPANAGLQVTNARGQPKNIGLVGTNRWSEQGMEAGYCLSVAYWGHGFATEAMKCFLDLYWTLPERKAITQLAAKTHPDNKASQGVCLKSGARRGEIIENAYERFVDKGEKSDFWCYYFDRPGEVTEETRGKWKEVEGKRIPPPKIASDLVGKGGQVDETEKGKVEAVTVAEVAP